MNLADKEVAMNIVERYKMKDKASVYHRSFADKLRTWWKLKGKGINYGEGCIVKADAEIKMTDNALLEMGSNVIIERFALLQLTKPSPHLVLGSHVSIGRGSILAIKGHTVIGDYTMLGPNCQINDQDHSFKKNDLIMNQRANIQPVKIGKDCWFGSGVRITKGVNIGDGAVVGAGSVVTCDVPPYEIWAGIPARFIRKRE